MKRCGLILVVLSGLLASGCARNFWQQSSTDQPPEMVVPTPTEASTILSCLAEPQKLSRKEYKAAYSAASEQAAAGTNAAMRLVCLSLHEYASSKQFKAGTATLANYIKEHPEAGTAGLQGIYVLMQRIDKEMTAKWIQNSKNLDEKGGLEAENKELLERNEALEKGAVQDQERIRALQAQIEQLKNIENIIKNREH